MRPLRHHHHGAQLQPASDAPVIQVARELSAQYARFWYRRIGIYLDRAGHQNLIDNHSSLSVLVLPHFANA
jgi:hypothetical protein